MTTKERAYLKGLAQNIDPILSLGKASLTPEFTEAVAEAIKARELIKVSVLKTCELDMNEIAVELCANTGAQLVQKIGKTLVLYKPSREKKILLP